VYIGVQGRTRVGSGVGTGSVRGSVSGSVSGSRDGWPGLVASQLDDLPAAGHPRPRGAGAHPVGWRPLMAGLAFWRVSRETRPLACHRRPGPASRPQRAV